MSCKVELTDFVKKGKLREETHEPNPLSSDVCPDESNPKRSLWERVEQKMRHRKKDAEANLLPSATDYPSASFNGIQASKRDVKVLGPSASFQGNQGTARGDEIKNALAYDPSYSLSSSSPNAWLSTTSKAANYSYSHSQTHSSAQTLADYHLHCQELYKHSSLFMANNKSSTNPPGKPVGRIKSEPPAAYYSAYAYDCTHDDSPALPVKETPTADVAPAWGQKNTELVIDRKMAQHSATYLEAPRPLYAHLADPSLDSMEKATVPNENRTVPQTFVPARTTSFPTTATSPQQAIATEPNISLPTPPSEEEQHLRKFAQQMTQHKCPGCNKDGPLFKIGAVFDHTEKILVSKKPHCIFKCKHSRCRVYYCPGCSQTRTATTPFRPSAINTVNSTGASTWCCASARLFFILLLLCGPHPHPRDGLASLLQDRQVKVKIGAVRGSVSSSADESASKDPQRLAGPAIGTGYERSGDYTSSGGGFPQSIGEKSLELLPELFAELRRAWPSTMNSSEFDQNPPELLLTMARRSPLMIKVAELLRDDCIEEVMHRASLYHSMFDFIHIVVAHPFSAPLVRDLRIEYPLSRTLLPVCFGTAYIFTPAMQQTCPANSKGKGKAKMLYEPPQDSLQSLASLLSSLTDQSWAVMRYLDAVSQDAAQILAMCQRICDLSDELQRPTVHVAEAADVYGPARPSSSSNEPAATLIAVVGSEEAREKKGEEMRTWLNKNKVAEIETDDWVHGYSFREKLTETAGSAPKPGRIKRIVYDLSMLRTSLPEGIFVRHDSSRLDAMKVLIVGPEGTPYDNGLFEFDLFCPLEYPNTPPLMKFKTTRSGRKFNPNLYVDGKICLSLLGTWSGEKWCPKTSTLLQLLVSIQAMIFCADPIWNEPGNADGLGAHASDLYNWEMRADTLVFAMSDWLSLRQTGAAGSATGNGLWDEVVGNHFGLWWRRILETAVRWEKENDPGVSFSASGLEFIMPGKCAAKRFRVGIRRLKWYFAEWARAEDDTTDLMKNEPKDESEADVKNTPVADQKTDDGPNGFVLNSNPCSLGSLESSE
ncbi:ubiquitin-conjugating enzyme [Colletotrichum incanum]|uniref:Ubiquitin-conjugating enzyme n=1 Tax=Colletotrichum incanum TaxID=1573173 RepID=A0A167DWR5_COLIC|nr:ubiquitin-conjugating enzyme [Colletotrichum incanum]